MKSRMRFRTLLALVTATIALGLSCTDNGPTKSNGVFQVVSITPADGAIGISRTPEIVVRFSQAYSIPSINTHNIYFDPSINFRIDYEAGADTLVLRPLDTLDYDRTYKLYLSTAIQSADGENLDKKTVVAMHTVLPSEFIAGVYPVNGQVGAPLNAPIKVMFTIPMDPATINSQTIRMASTMTTTVTYDSASTTAIVTPDGPLLPSTDYSLTVSATVMTLGGFPIGQPYTWQFQTADHYFHVDMTNPTQGQTDVSPHDTISLAFSSQIDEATITPATVYLTPSADYTFTYDDLQAVLTIIPSGGLAPDQSYQLTVTDGLHAKNGDRLAQNATFNFSIRPRLGLYVAPGGSGDGSVNSPMGSIQQAVDSAIADTLLSAVYVAVGAYDGIVRIGGPIEIVGGLDPADNWQPSETDSTVINGGTEAGNGFGVIVASPNGGVALTSLTVVAPDADSAGGGSFGVICSSAAEVAISQCRIRAGQGLAGRDGDPGQDGDDAWGGYPFNYKGGLEPSPGGDGGSGGEGAKADGSQGWTTGSPGKCPDGSDGGAAGQPGNSGGDGGAGAGGTALVAIQYAGSLPLVSACPGESGTDGTGGCGGGGGNGTDFWFYVDHVTDSIYYVDGCWGDPGGGGGAGGGGGEPGTAGGCSVGVLQVNAKVDYVQVDIRTGAGGLGGAGGTGGTGGLGGDEPAYGQCVYENGFGNAGGDGGDGGHGGDGGGGSGGWSIGVALASGSTMEGTQPTISLGVSGAGGSGPAGNSGQGGKAVTVYTAP